MHGVKEQIWALIKKHQGLVIAVILLVMMALVLLLPTIKPLRTVEIRPENEGPFLGPEAPLVNDVFVPAGKLSYFIVWIDEGRGANSLGISDYETVKLEVGHQDGRVIRTADRPALIKRDDKSALLFKFDKIESNGEQRYVFILRQEGSGVVRAQQPLKDYIKKDEVASVAFQLGERKNWLTLLIDKVYGESLIGQDISFYLHRGRQIAAGENPYSCVLEEESCVGYPAHLPGMYLFTAGFVAMGFDELDEWAKVWRPIMLMAWFSVGVVLLVYIFRHGQPVLAVAAFGFWLFNRWSLDVLRIAHIDFIGVLFLVLAVVLAGRLPLLAAVLFGASLAVKQVAVLVAPIFLLAVWRQKKSSVLQLAVLTGLMLLVPAVTSLPFLLDNPNATVQGWLNVVERPAQSVRGFAPSFDEWLDVTHVGKLLVMLLLVGVVYVAAWRKEVGLIEGVLIVMAIIMAFTPVLYNQYFVWLIPFIPLAVAGLRRRGRSV